MESWNFGNLGPKKLESWNVGKLGPKIEKWECWNVGKLKTREVRKLESYRSKKVGNLESEAYQSWKVKPQKHWTKSCKASTEDLILAPVQILVRMMIILINYSGVMLLYILY